MTVPGNLSSPLLATAAADGAVAAGVATRSLRFNSEDSAYLSRTPSSAGNRTTWTWSAWIKRAKIGTAQRIFTGATSNADADFTAIHFVSDKLYISGYNTHYRISDRLFRDPGAWFHLVVKYELGASAEADKIKAWFNGDEITWGTSNTAPSTSGINAANNHTLGAEQAPNNGSLNSYCDLYLADVYFIDGLALSPTSFGAYDSNNVWQAAAYSGTFGTNGFHLKFDDASSNAALGTDSSGNSNTWTVNNLVASAPATAKGGFDVVTYTGNGSSQSITGLGFTPGLVWVKERSGSDSHCLTDVVRGNYWMLRSDLTNADSQYGNVGIHSLTSGGFSVGSGSAVNSNNETYVAWCWKAGGAAVSNTDGSITSSVSANTDYGFSIVSYTGTGANATIGHGLNATPKWIIAKTRDSAVNWIIYHASLSSDGFLRFTAAAEDNNTTVWNTAPTSSVFGVGSANGVNESGDDYIAYCWSEVPGFSKFDTYTGTGSAGLEITTGFKPRYVLIRRKAGGDWFIFDNERDSTNPVYARLYANLANSEDTGTANGINFLDDGFSIPTTHAGLNASSAYIYAAFSAQPPGDLIDSLFDSPANGAQSDTGAGGEVSGNYATWNPLNKPSTITLSNGNLDCQLGSSDATQLSTIGMSSGKWYVEITGVSTTGSFFNAIGLAEEGAGGYLGSDAKGWGYHQDGRKIAGGGASSYGATYAQGDVIGVAFDADNGTLAFYKNGSSQGTAYTGLTSGPYFFACGSSQSKNALNAGQRAFAYTAPTNYKALCTTNLPTPAIADPSTAFDVALWTGNGSARSISTNNSPDFVWMKARTLGSANHGLFDTIRGATKRLISHSTAKESTQSQTLTAFNSDGFDLGTDSAYNGNTYPVVGWAWDAGANSNKTYTVKVVSDSGNKYRFDDFGTSAVTLDLEEGSTYVFDQSDSSNSGHPLRFSTTSDGTHNSGSEYTTGVTTTGTPGSAGAKTTIVVAASAPTLYYYCSVHSGMGGQANTNSTAGASNFDGTIQTTVKASQTAGFSIVSWNASSQSAAYIGHGLGKQPELIFAKTYDGTGNWYVFEPSLDTGGTISKALYLNSSGGKVTVSGVWGHWDEMTSTTFGVYDTSGSYTNDGDMIAYCFTSADQFSSFGTYTGNGSTDGPFVALSFRPAFLLLKNTGSTGNWLIYDNKREGYNFNNDPLYAQLAAEEGTTDYLDLLSNGFKIRNTHSSINGSSNTYLYAAFALHPLSANGGLAR